jgi:hypothetical protein
VLTNFTGLAPTSLSNALNLQTLVLSANLLDGEIPNNPGSLHNLSYFDLSWNQLESGDRTFLSSLTNGKKLRSLNLMGNNLTGNLQNSVENLTKELKISVLGGVYSYGIILLEMLTGKRPTDDMCNGGLNLHRYVNASFQEKIEEILDITIS